MTNILLMNVKLISAFTFLFGLYYDGLRYRLCRLWRLLLWFRLWYGPVDPGGEAGKGGGRAVDAGQDGFGGLVLGPPLQPACDLRVTSVT